MDPLENKKNTLREMCPYPELFWHVFSRIRTEYGMRENADQNNSECGHFLRGDSIQYHLL